MEKFKTLLTKPQVWGFFVSIVVMACISLAFFFPNNIDGDTLSQPDMLQGMANGQEGAAYQAATGEKALWTNSLFSGMPTFQISPSYPSNSLFTWLNTLYGLGLPSPSNLLFMMMFGFLIMMYCMGYKWYYGLIGAVAWGFSTYFVIIIGAGHIWKFVTLSYIPPTIGGLVLCYRNRYVLGGALTALFGMLQLNANHPQMTYYFAFVIIGFAIAYLATAIKHKTVGKWCISGVVLIVAAALAVGANLPSLYNSYMYAKETQRAQSELTQPVDNNTKPERPTGGMPKSQIVGWSYGASELYSLLVPNIKGGASDKPQGGQMVALGLDRLEGAQDLPLQQQQILQYFSQYFNDSEGTYGPVYVGALICALFLVGLVIVRSPIKWVLAALTLLSILLALGRNFESLTDFMIYNFPMYSKFRAVESILVIAEFTMPLLAVMALVEIVRIIGQRTSNPAAVKNMVYTVAYAFGFCALICVVGIIFPGFYGDVISSQDKSLLAQLNEYGVDIISLRNVITDLRHDMIQSDALRSLSFLLLGFIAIISFYKGYISCRWAVAAIGVLVLVDLYGVDKRYVDSDSFVPAVMAPVTNFTPDAIDRQILADTDGVYRVMDYADFGGARRSYFHKMVGGYHAAKLNRYNDLITTGVIGQENVLDMLNARYIIGKNQNGELSLVPNPYALGNAWFVDSISYVDGADAEMQALTELVPRTEAVADSRFRDVLGKAAPVSPADDITLTDYSPNTLKYVSNSQHGGLAVFSEVYFPWGWHATVDGQPAEIGRVNYVLRAMHLPAGKHEVVMTFDPESLHTTATVAYISIILIYLSVIAGVAMWFVNHRKDDDGRVKVVDENIKKS